MISFHESPTSAKSQKHAQRVPRLYSYVVTFDGGFAPNPFWGYCTLACCKPKIRRTAQKWDWVVGLTPKSQGNNLVYAMCITEDPLTFDDYFNNEDFQNKKPTTMRHSPKRNCGDNIYEQRGDGRYKQLFSIHSGEPGSKKRDLSGKYVLASHDFYYFGVIPKKLPEYLRTLIVGRGHKCNFPQRIIQAFERFIRRQRKGINALPHEFEDFQQDRELQLSTCPPRHLARKHV
ncbi:MAG: hypothetical protein ACLQVG_09805 [Terriglobia bacterium]